jgi:hypothetical protein
VVEDQVIGHRLFRVGGSMINRERSLAACPHLHRHICFPGHRSIGSS